MDYIIAIYNALMDYQIELAVGIIFIIWLVVRGGDFLAWVIGKLKRKKVVLDEKKEENKSGT
ncbi:MAG TPA: hypothetical protein ENJ82_03930 [Bacteroidetes bacterium]|nr:hypothetical protein [Bacteroidota bacterium]